MRFTTVIRAGIATVAAMLLGIGLLAASPSASAQPSTAEPSTSSERSADRTAQLQRKAKCNWRRKRCFGAISLNTRTGELGLKYDARNKKRARKAAQRKCKRRSSAFPRACKRAGWVRNGCMAASIRIRNGRIVEWRTRAAYHKGPAKKKAKRALRGNKGKKRIAGWVCTTRHR